MNMNHLRPQLDLPQADIDPEVFADALVVQQVSSLISCGGGSIGRPYLESALQPQQLEGFLDCAANAAQKTGHFEREWSELQQAFPHIKAAWQKGQSLFREDLDHAIGDSKEMGILSQVDFASDLYAFVSTFDI